MKRIVVSSMMMMMMVLSYGQQQEHYSMYMQNNYLINPAEGGTDEFTDLKLSYRTQWVDFGNTEQGGPKTVYASVHTPINKRENKFDDITPMPFHGVGGALISDDIGPFNIITAKASYAYHLPVSKTLTLSVGAFAGIKQYSVQGDELAFSSDPTATDPFASSFKTAIVPDISFGIWGYSKTYYFGIASFQLLNSEIDIYKDIDRTLTNANTSGSLAKHHWFTAGYKVDFDEDWFLVPSVVMKYVQNAPFTFDLNAKLRYQDKYWMGVSFRKEDAIVLLAGITAKKKYDIAYSYDITRTDIRKYSAGSHEIVLGLRIPNHYRQPPPAQFW